MGYTRSFGTILVLAVMLFVSCNRNSGPEASVLAKADSIPTGDTLHVGILSGPVSYFLFRDEMMGYDLELAQNLADSLKMNLKVSEAKTPDELINFLADGTIDIAATALQQTKALKKQFDFVFPNEDSYPVLVQRLNISTIGSVLELKDKKVVLPAGTQYDVQMQLLNEDTGNAFEIEIAPDSLNQEDLIEMVANGKIDYTVAEVKVARLYKSYYKKLDVRLPLGFSQRNGWLLRKDNECLRRYIEKWSVTNEMELLKTNLAYKYLRNSYYFNQKKVRIPKGAISPYDHLFKKFAPEIKWEWQMLAALVFHESRFDSAQVSWAGASGLMQLMPRTAANFGLSRRNIFNPESNIEAGVQYIKSLNLTFSKIEDKHERIKFILASYNSGPAHVLDARALAAKYGKNPDIWFDNVEIFLLKKSDSKYYNDPVVKYGRFRGRETVAFVQKILSTHEKYKLRK